MNVKDYKSYQELLKEAEKLDVVELFKKAYNIGYSVGFDTAVKILEEGDKKC